MHRGEPDAGNRRRAIIAVIILLLAIVGVTALLLSLAL